MIARLRYVSLGGYILAPIAALAHDGAHIDAPWYLSLQVGIWGGIVVMLLGAIVAVRYYHSRPRMAAGAAFIAATTLGVALFLGSQNVPQPVSETVSLAGVTVAVYKSPGCSCCEGYIAALKSEGAKVEVHEISDAELALKKDHYGIAPHLQSCHTSIVDGYVVEGHVPFEALATLIAETPSIEGIALPGMPSGTPGMPGLKWEPYRIYTLDGGDYLTL